MKDKVLPFIYMIPKFHKETLDYRYIAAAKTSSTKVISEVFSSILKLADRTLNYSDRFEFNFKNTSGYWIVKNYIQFGLFKPCSTCKFYQLIRF